MGEVYRARDARLGREVAIKVLPPAFASDSERLDRFEQEARAAAALNHPNLLAVYDLGRYEHAPFIVSELLEGETLRERIAASPLPVRKAVDFAVQVAHGLAAAHEKGIVHRDLKPENLFVTSDGRVKVLDFGLAKLVQPEGTAAGVSALPTTPNTLPGVVLGTVGYMAPEQVRGVPADHRADIFALGAILYEMLAGRRAFTGETTMDAMTAILKEDPPDLPSAERHIPPALERIVARCLEKSPAARFQSMRDLAFALEGLSATSDTGALPASGEQTTKRPRVAAYVPWTLAAVSVLAAFAALAAFLFNRPSAPSVERLSVVVPAANPLGFGWTPGLSLAISPDGSRLVFVGQNLERPVGEQLQLFTRSLESLDVRAIPGTEDARQPFFSPDGAWVGFFTRDGLKKVSLAGGNPVTLVGGLEGAIWGSGAWGEDGTIVFGTPTAGLRRVSADGGTPQEVTTVGEQENEHGYPAPVPGTDAVVFWVRIRGSEGRLDAVRLATGERRIIAENASRPLCLESGHLLFRRDDALLAARWDADGLAIAGPLVPLIDLPRSDGPADAPGNVSQLVVSRTGTMAYVPMTGTGSRLYRVSRDGTAEPLRLPPAAYLAPRVSPDGQHVAVQVGRGLDAQVQVYDVLRATTTRLSQQGFDISPAWHPSNGALTVSSRSEERRGVLLKNPDGSVRQQLLEVPLAAPLSFNFGWTPDGSRLAYTDQTRPNDDIWIVPVDNPQGAEPLINGPRREHSPRFSPDGRWLAYVSDESGRMEVYVRRVPQGERATVSTGGGSGPAWSRDGRELFFQSTADGVPRLMRVAVSMAGDRLQLGRPERLLDLRVPGPSGAIEQYANSTNQSVAYDVFPDGSFVMIRGADPQGAREIVVVKNFYEEVRRLTSRQ
jgi:Tol biopolymer transport system component